MLPFKTFISKIKIWAEEEVQICGILLVGSYARDVPKPDSDIDLVILFENPESYIENSDWIYKFGEVARYSLENWGKLNALRVFYEQGFEVEFGLTSKDWASIPTDEGTMKVIKGGAKIIIDKNGLLKKLLNEI